MSNENVKASLPTAPPSAVKQQRPAWLAWSLGSGAFAAFNGVFAKLTTADVTNTIAAGISTSFGLETSSPLIELIVRGLFFGLNLLSNAIMWILFTRALTAATSTTQVSILNTSANFMTTAVLGMLIFGEKLPLQWWLGASLLITGSVIIGAREEKAPSNGAADNGPKDVALNKADAVAVGADGIGEDTIAQGKRFKDDTDRRRRRFKP